MTKFLANLGIALTVLYLFGAWWLFEGRLPEIRALKPNEVGDLLAGVFGPLAILWVILGYFQQGQELRVNTEALRLQAEELRHSVEQQRQLVEVSREQLKVEMEAIQTEQHRMRQAQKPRFAFRGALLVESSGSTWKYAVEFINLGSSATALSLQIRRTQEHHDPDSFQVWARDQKHTFSWRIASDNVDPFLVSIAFTDAGGLPGEQLFRVLHRPGFPLEVASIAENEPYT
jgi:hypothetical protein